jgi:protein-L-isoaspartate(D-aspartate) O-methyltransferase
MDTIENARRCFAEEIKFRAHVASPKLLRAFATVPREEFLGEGPWRVRSDVDRSYWTTESADCAHVYHDVLIAIDESRALDNGMPSTWAHFFDILAPDEGEHVVHVGSGTGYYTAILSNVVGSQGRITAVEFAECLAQRAKHNLAERTNVQVIHADGLIHDPGRADVIIVNAGVARPSSVWLDSLSSNGRLLFPLTLDDGHGWVLLIKRIAESYEAREVCPIDIYPCQGGRERDTSVRLMASALAKPVSSVRSLRRDEHKRDRTCWFHDEGFCLSTNEPGRH